MWVGIPQNRLIFTNWGVRSHSNNGLCVFFHTRTGLSLVQSELSILLAHPPNVVTGVQVFSAATAVVQQNVMVRNEEWDDFGADAVPKDLALKAELVEVQREVQPPSLSPFGFAAPSRYCVRPSPLLYPPAHTSLVLDLLRHPPHESSGGEVALVLSLKTTRLCPLCSFDTWLRCWSGSNSSYHCEPKLRKLSRPPLQSHNQSLALLPSSS